RLVCWVGWPLHQFCRLIERDSFNRKPESTPFAFLVALEGVNARFEQLEFKEGSVSARSQFYVLIIQRRNKIDVFPRHVGDTHPDRVRPYFCGKRCRKLSKRSPLPYSSFFRGLAHSRSEPDQ